MIFRHQLTGKVFLLIIIALGLTDYTFIIKSPMDLGTANQKLKTDKYRFVEEALDDIQLIWDNCKTYNHP